MFKMTIYLHRCLLIFECSAVDDIEQIEAIRSILEDLQNIRQDKIRNGLSKIASDVQHGGTAYAIQVGSFGRLKFGFNLVHYDSY